MENVMNRIKWGKKIVALVLFVTMLVTSGCGTGKQAKDTKTENKTGDGYQYTQELQMIDDQTRTYYEIFVYSFYDSNGDGIGDLQGVIEKLDYIQDMGYNGIWLMPIMPSPTYHKYDTTDYCAVDSDYGTLEDMEQLIAECHKRDIRLIIDFMMNHTSREHAWFQEAYQYLSKLKKGKKPSAKECKYVDYYHFVSEDEKGTGYYQVGNTKWYYEGAFWDGMPDLNLENEAVRKELEEAAKFWLDKGVDGFRLDGVLYFTGNDKKNIEILKWFHDYVVSVQPEAYIVGEVWTNYNVAVQYLKSGIDSVFDFSFGQANGIIVKDVRQSGTGKVGRSFADSMVNIQEMTDAVNGEMGGSATVAEFLTNHDTGRMANILGKEDKIKIAYAMELFMTGNAFVYYGEDIALTGAGKDENFRAPMYWSATDQTGMCDGPEDMDQFENIFPSLEEQEKDPKSIHQFIKRCIRIRNENPEIARGKVAVIPEVTDEAICAITKTYEDSQIVMLYNLSTETKTVTLDQKQHKYQGIRGYVSADGSEVTLEGDSIMLPPYSVVVLK